MELLILLPKKAQLRSKTASSNTTQKVEVFLKGGKQHSSVLAVTSQSLRSHFAVTSQLLYNAVTTLRGHQGYYGHYGHHGHYAVTTVLRSQKEHIFETEKLNFVPKRTLLL